MAEIEAKCKYNGRVVKEDLLEDHPHVISKETADWGPGESP